MNEIYEQLRKPFDKTHQKQGLDYLTGEQVTSRLNEALGWDKWSFRILEHGYNESADEFWALGQIEIYVAPSPMVGELPIVRQQFGSQKPNRFRESGKIIDLGFDLKGAATDALKKCASLIGVGLYLHEKEGGQSNGSSQQGAGATQTPPANEAARRTPPAAAPAKKPTFWEWAASMKYDRKKIEDESDRLFGTRDPTTLNADQKRRLSAELAGMKEMAIAQ